MRKVTTFYTWLGYIAIIYLLMLFAYPIVQVTMTSFLSHQGFTLKNYVDVLTTSLYLDVLIKTLWVSVVSCAVALVLSFSLAYFISTRKSKHQGMWLIAIVAPMFMSLTIRLFGWMIVLSQGGPIAGFIGWLTDKTSDASLLFSTPAVIVGIVHYVIPFMVLSIYSALKKIDPVLLEASTLLGSSPARTFRKVIVPLAFPGVCAGLSIAFALSASTFLVPLMLGGPKDNLLANMAYRSIETIGNTGMGAALSIVLLIVVVIVLFILGRVERRNGIV